MSTELEQARIDLANKAADKVLEAARWGAAGPKAASGGQP